MCHLTHEKIMTNHLNFKFSGFTKTNLIRLDFKIVLLHYYTIEQAIIELHVYMCE